MPGPISDSLREVWLLADTDQIIKGTHSGDGCKIDCVIHRPSAHHMRQHKLGFDISRKAFYRTCSHGEVHHDPDERAYWTGQLERALKLESRGTKLGRMSMDKLSAWACPTCKCGCCDITSLARK